MLYEYDGVLQASTAIMPNPWFVVFPYSQFILHDKYRQEKYKFTQAKKMVSLPSLEKKVSKICHDLTKMFFLDVAWPTRKSISTICQGHVTIEFALKPPPKIGGGGQTKLSTKNLVDWV